MQQFPRTEISMTSAMVPTYAPPPRYSCRAVQNLQGGRLSECSIQTKASETDSDGAMAPCRRAPGTFQPAEIYPILLLLVPESVFKGERFPGQLLVLRISSCAREMSQSPANTGNAVGKAPNPFRV
jgi:hypothetical protein